MTIQKNGNTGVANIMQQMVANASKPNTNGPKVEAQVASYIEANKDKIASMLPSIVSPKRFTQIVLTTINDNPALLACGMNSLISAIAKMSQIGLDPGPLGHVYIVPFKGRAQVIIGYKGYVQLLINSGLVSYVDAQPVYKGDYFKYQYGSTAFIDHIPNPDNADFSDKNIDFFYAIVKFKDGGSFFKVLSTKQVMAVRDEFSKASTSQDSPWSKHFVAMGCKTVLRKCMAYLPVSIENNNLYNAERYDGNIVEIKPNDYTTGEQGAETEHLLDPSELEGDNTVIEGDIPETSSSE